MSEVIWFEDYIGGRNAPARLSLDANGICYMNQSARELLERNGPVVSIQVGLRIVSEETKEIILRGCADGSIGSYKLGFPSGHRAGGRICSMKSASDLLLGYRLRNVRVRIEPDEETGGIKFTVPDMEVKTP